MYEDEYPVRHSQRTRRKHSKIHYDSVIFKDISMHIFGNTTSEMWGWLKHTLAPPTLKCGEGAIAPQPLAPTLVHVQIVHSQLRQNDKIDNVVSDN